MALLLWALRVGAGCSLALRLVLLELPVERAEADAEETAEADVEDASAAAVEEVTGADADESPDLVERMIVMWKGMWREFLPLSAIAEAAAMADIRQHGVGWDQLADGSWAAAQSLPSADI